MGNSCTSSNTPQTKYKILSDQYNLFDIPSDLDNNRHLNINQSDDQVIFVNGKKYIKGNFYSAKTFLNPIEYEKQINNYFNRYQSKQSELFPIVKIIGVKQKEQNNICSTWKWYNVVTEQLIPLNQIEDTLSYEECLYILFQALMGFYYLYIKNESFQITQKMIAINKQGKAKVWLNQNFAQNISTSSPIEVYINRNITAKGQQTEKLKNCTYQKHMIKQIISILQKKYHRNQISFSQTLQTNIKRCIPDFSIQQSSFEDFLKSLCIYEQKSVNSLFIPNKIKIQREYQSKLPQKQSFSLKLQKAINSYQCQKSSLQLQSQKSFTTGVQGNTRKQYVKGQQILAYPSFIKPEIKFHYQDYSFQNNYNFTASRSPFHFSQIYKDYEVKDAQSEIIGVRKSQYTERLDDFNIRGKQQVLNTYVPGDYQNEIQNLSKDMRDTYFKSTGDSQFYQSYLPKSRSYAQNSQYDPTLYISSSQMQMGTSKSGQDNFGRLYTSPAQQSYSLNNGNFSTYKQKLRAQYLESDPTNNFMRITQEPQPESIRPSLMSINVDGKNSFEKRTNPNIVSKPTSKFRQSPMVMQQNIIAPIIESRFTQGPSIMRVSPDYIEKPFCLNEFNQQKFSLDQYDKQNYNTGTSFY